jgi:hypothetical protein
LFNEFIHFVNDLIPLFLESPFIKAKMSLLASFLLVWEKEVDTNENDGVGSNETRTIIIGSHLSSMSA